MPLIPQIKNRLAAKLQSTMPLIPPAILSHFDNLTSIAQLPEGQLTPSQMLQTKNLILQRAFTKDLEGLRQEVEQLTPPEKMDLFVQLRDLMVHDKAAGDFGIFRRQNEVLRNFTVPPLDVKPRLSPFIPLVNTDNPQDLGSPFRGKI